MNDKCNPTGAWFNPNYVLTKLEEAEAWAKTKYEEDLEKAIVKRIGMTVPVKGWKGIFLGRKRLTTREDAEEIVRHSDQGFWYPVEYSLRTSRDDFLDEVKKLRLTATTAKNASIANLFVSKADMVYLS